MPIIMIPKEHADELVHGQHKYIRKEPLPNGKYRYIYSMPKISDLKKRNQSVFDKKPPTKTTNESKDPTVQNLEKTSNDMVNKANELTKEIANIAKEYNLSDEDVENLMYYIYTGNTSEINKILKRKK